MRFILCSKDLVGQVGPEEKLEKQEQHAEYVTLHEDNRICSSEWKQQRQEYAQLLDAFDRLSPTLMTTRRKNLTMKLCVGDARRALR